VGISTVTNYSPLQVIREYKGKYQPSSVHALWHLLIYYRFVCKPDALFMKSAVNIRVPEDSYRIIRPRWQNGNVVFWRQPFSRNAV